MTENVRKLVGVAAIAALVVVGVVVSSGDDTNFTRNAAYIKFDGFRQLPEAQQARLAPAFAPQAAPKTNKASGQIKAGIVLQASGQIKAGIVLQSGGTNAYAQKLWTGKASVLKGRGPDGKGGTSSFRAGTAMNGKIGKAGIWLQSGGANALSGRKAGIWLQNGGVDGVADRIEKCASGGDGNSSIAVTNPLWTVASLKNVLVTSYMENTKDIASGYNCQDLQGKDLLPDDTSFPAVVNPDSMKPLLLAECMESKVGGVFLKSHTEAMAADCVAIVLPELSPERAKRLGTYWQTPEQLSVWTNEE
jgi:hypothetical protein